jgi:hypothetical protein
MTTRDRLVQQVPAGKTNESRKRPSRSAFGIATTCGGQTLVGSVSSMTNVSSARHPWPEMMTVVPGMPSGGAIWIDGATTGVFRASHPEGKIPRDCIKNPAINTASTRINTPPTTANAINIKVDHLSRPLNTLFGLRAFSISSLRVL